MDYFKIREARKRANFTQEDLAIALGINRATLSKYENGIIEPTISQLIRIAEELEISPLELLPESIKESWVSGKDYGADQTIQKIFEYGYRISDDEIKLINFYWSLNLYGKEKAMERIQELTEIPRYRVRRYHTEPPPAASPANSSDQDTPALEPSPETPKKAE